MALTPGSRLGVFELTDLLGRGGMGEVFRARDTKLDRDVAIKVLPEAFAKDSERLTRFTREAKTLASLNHPNIGAIYGLEESAGITALVMEFVEGEDLSQRIARGAIPLDEALPIARQIAEALEAAHEQGVIHRDLKPANIKVRGDGTVKVLDFGLAKAMERTAGSSPSMSQSPTITTPAMTQAGMILGTAAYMSPEQARGRPVDRRADIWAFGAVLFEMLTGRRAFGGEDVAETLANVINKEPAWDALPAATPTHVRQTLRLCLRKPLRERVPDIGAVRLALEGAFETAAPQTTGAAAQPVPSPASKLLMAAAGGLALVAVVTSGALWRATRPADQPLRPLVRLDVDLGSDMSLGATVGTDVSISPDGTRLVYVSQGRLFTRRLDQPAATELAGTQGAYAPFFSPDGQSVAFFANGSLKKISVEGGSAVALCRAGTARGGSWGEDGTIVAALTASAGLSRIPAAGGPPTLVTDLRAGEGTHRWPHVLPGGKAILFSASVGGGTGYETGTIEAMSLTDHRRTTLVRGGTFGRYLPSGHLVYVSGGTLFAVPFDVDRLEVHGTPAPVLDQASYNAADGSAQLAFSQTGTLLYRSRGAGGSGLSTAAWLDAAGKRQPLLAKPGAYGRPSLSPDGQRLALDISDGSDTALWLYDWPRDTLTRLTFTGTASQAVWSPDGRYIAFRAAGEGMSATRADGSGKAQSLTQSKNSQYPWSFTPDGTRLAFMEQSAAATYDLWTIPLAREGTGLRWGKPEGFLQTAADERYPAFSPDGRWLAYTSDESGAYQVYVRTFPDTGGKWQISNSSGTYPMWSRTGHELFFETLENHIMAAAYTVKGESFVADKPRLWSETQLGGIANVARTVDLAPDGKRVVALMPLTEAKGAQEAQNHVVFLLNFFDELRRKVPVGQ